MLSSLVNVVLTFEKTKERTKLIFWCVLLFYLGTRSINKMLYLLENFICTSIRKNYFRRVMTMWRLGSSPSEWVSTSSLGWSAE